jgi:methylmalonyl-CoA mutase N-terminal domain/subunit
MRERFGARNDEAMKLRFHAQTGGSTLAAQQIDNNVVRVALQALAAVLGGCQSLHTNARDEALALPTESSATLALRTQQVIAHESGAADTVDPLGGSYYVEALTDELEHRAWQLITKIDEMGGAVKAIEQKFYQQEIMESAYRYQLALERKEKIVIGVNEFAGGEQSEVEIMKIDESVARKQVARLAEIRSARSNATVRSLLSDLKAVALTRENLIPFILRAVEAYASVGEISDALREVWGEHKE